MHSTGRLNSAKILTAAQRFFKLMKKVKKVKLLMAPEIIVAAAGSPFK